MASATTIQLYHSFFFLLFFFFFSAAVLHSSASATQEGAISHHYHVLPRNDVKNPTMPQHKLQLFKEEIEDGNIIKGRSYGRRLLIGSMAPICTYNECRGCKLYTKKCWAEQVPVEGNDPINSAYHYKCVCHR
ncbi:EPIDERMAL PATTERNING FACTOR-like protein 9 [Linum grandiflorum]